MKLRCMIIDDEPPAVRLIQSFIDRTEVLECVGGYTDSVEAVQKIKQNPPEEYRRSPAHTRCKPE